MRNSATATTDALAAAPDEGIVPRSLFWAVVKDRDTGDPVEMGFWSGDYTIDIEVIDGETGDPVERTYVGGVNLEVGSIARVADLTMQRVTATMSAIAPSVQNMVRGHEARGAKVEVHICLLDPRTRLPVAPPEIDFLGEVDGAPVQRGAAGGESVVELELRSAAMSMLTRTNPRKRSHEGQKRRSNDQFGRYSNSVGTWKVAWGAEAQG